VGKGVIIPGIWMLQKRFSAGIASDKIIDNTVKSVTSKDTIFSFNLNALANIRLSTAGGMMLCSRIPCKNGVLMLKYLVKICINIIARMGEAMYFRGMEIFSTVP
jgi:hypothetical protein